MEIIVILVIVIVFLIYRLFFISTKKNKLAENLIPYERIRTLLYLSKFKKKKIWIVLYAPDQTYDKAQVVSGVVDAIINGTKATEEMRIEDICIDGRFSLSDNNQESIRYDMSHIRGVSLQPISKPDEIKGPFSPQYDENTLVSIEHFDWHSTKMLLPPRPFDDHYYRVLAKL